MATALLGLVGCAGHLDSDDFYLPTPDIDPEEDPVHALRRSTDPQTGEVVATWAVLRYPDGRVIKDGQERRFYPDGAPRSRRDFRLGEPEGEWTTWYPDGALRSEYTFTGTPSAMKFFHPSGRLSALGMARDGVRQGPWTFWFPDGALRQQGAYVAGKREGVWTLRHEGGALRSRGHFLDDERVGEWKHWDAIPPVTESDWQPPELASRTREGSDG